MSVNIVKKSIVNTFLFSLGVRGNFCVLHVPNLLVWGVCHVTNEGYLFEIFTMRFLTKLLALYTLLKTLFILNGIVQGCQSNPGHYLAHGKELLA